MAEIKYLSNEGFRYVWQKISDNFVQKVVGKGLSTNDLTNELLTKINSASTFDGIYSSLTSKPQINNVELTGNKTLSDIGVTKAINDAIATISSIRFTILTDGEYNPTTHVPTVEGESNVFYLVPSDGLENDLYYEYIYINSKYEYIGTTAVDLTNYLQKTDLVSITNAEIDIIIGGE